jgi:preprotein translocase subunit SecE
LWRATSGPAPLVFLAAGCRDSIEATGGRSCGRLMANPVQFVQEVRTEANKVTWPTRRETLITTGMVLVMVIVASAFFVAVDQALHFVVALFLRLGH